MRGDGEERIQAATWPRRSAPILRNLVPGQSRKSGSSVAVVQLRGGAGLTAAPMAAPRIAVPARTAAKIAAATREAAKPASTGARGQLRPTACEMLGAGWQGGSDGLGGKEGLQDLDGWRMLAA